MNFKDTILQEIQIKKELSYYELTQLCRRRRKKISYAERLLRRMRDKGDEYYVKSLQIEKSGLAIIKYFLK